MSIRIVLVETSHPGNIGAAARAMKNMGLTELVLVRPRYFPHPDARARASGADDVLDQARVVERFADAVDDCVLVMGTSARSRAMPWPRLHARDAAAKALSLAAVGNVALVFGPENNGLCSQDLDRCQLLVSIPSDPAFSSLNLGMAVQVMAYELRAQHSESLPAFESEAPPAAAAAIEHFHAELEALLLELGFLDPDNPRHLMRRLRRLVARAAPDVNEINILNGILRSIVRDRQAGP